MRITHEKYYIPHTTNYIVVIVFFTTFKNDKCNNFIRDIIADLIEFFQQLIFQRSSA